MQMNKQLREKVMEALTSILPITAIVLLLSVTVAPLGNSVMMLFLFGALMLIAGMGLFTLGAEMSMLPMGEGIGVQLSKNKKIVLPVVVCFILGVVITMAEPDLQVLATQIPSAPNMVLILSIAVGVGGFLAVAVLRMIFHIRLSTLLIGFYGLVFLLAIFAPDSFIPAAFDSGGVTTGPITVPFIMALGLGLTAMRSDKDSENDSFGLIALSSIGPILSVLVLGIFYKPAAVTQEPVPLADLTDTRDVMREFLTAFPAYAKEVLAALLPIAAIFLLFQLLSRRFRRRQLLRIVVGFLYTYVGLALFLTGANVGFMPAGQLIGTEIAGGAFQFLLIPVGMLLGYFIVAAEPAVHVLKKQVEEVSNGAIPQRTIRQSLSIGVALSVGLSMLRIILGIHLFWFLVPGYLLSLAMTFFVPPLFTAVAFDSGGVASGAMTTTFLLPMAMGACTALGGDLMTDAFGIVAMVAMTPLITIQSLGVRAELKKKAAHRKFVHQLEQVEDTILYFDEEPETMEKAGVGEHV